MASIKELAGKSGLTEEQVQRLVKMFGEGVVSGVIDGSRFRGGKSAGDGMGVTYKGQRSPTSVEGLLSMHIRNKAAINDLSAKIEASAQRAETTAPKTKAASTRTIYERALPGLYTSDQERKTKAQQDAANEKAMRRAIPGVFAKSDDDSGVDYSRIFPGLYDKK